MPANSHVQIVTQHNAPCCAILENLQSALSMFARVLVLQSTANHNDGAMRDVLVGYLSPLRMLLKATQQALQIPGLVRPMRVMREENYREQAALLHMLSDYERKLA